MLQAMLTEMSEIIRGNTTTMASGIFVSIRSDYGLSPVRHRNINSSNANFCLLYPEERILIKCLMKFTGFQSQNAFEMPSEQCHLACSFINELMMVQFTRSHDWLR